MISKFADFAERETLTREIREKLIEAARLSARLEFGSPWLGSIPTKKFSYEKFISGLDLPVEECDNQEIRAFLDFLVGKRVTAMSQFAFDERLSKKNYYDLFGISINKGLYFSTIMIPSLFGHFIAEDDITDFFESLEKPYAVMKQNPRFYELFNKSFLANIIRQFFFTAQFREVLSKSVVDPFYDLFSSAKLVNDSAKASRFLYLYLTELPPHLAVMPRTVNRLFSIFKEDKKTVFSIFLYCILLPMIQYPKAYGVVPSSAVVSYSHEMPDIIVSFFCQYAEIPPPSEIKSRPMQEILDPKLFDGLYSALIGEHCGVNDVPHLGFRAFHLQSLEFMSSYAKKENGQQAHQVLERMSSSPNTVLIVEDAIAEDSSYKVFMDYVKSYDPEAPPVSAVAKAESLILSKEIIKSEVTKSELLHYQKQIFYLDNLIEQLNDSVSSAEAWMVSKFLSSVYTESSFVNDFNKKSQAMIENPDVISSFVIAQTEQIIQKNQFLTRFAPFVAQEILTWVSRKFPVDDFIRLSVDKIPNDQEFLVYKYKILEGLETRETDANVHKLISNKEIFESPQNCVLRACLFQIPFESALQIVHSLTAVEELFKFETGDAPEANQLMPLLANLFILSPVPYPLGFGAWLQHFIAGLVQKKPEWFCGDRLRPLEHYFQFNAFMLDAVANQ